jgi:hypothetical protein
VITSRNEESDDIRSWKEDRTKIVVVLNLRLTARLDVVVIFKTIKKDLKIAASS